MNKYSLAIVGSGALWGLMGVFTRALTARGFSSPDTVFIRCLIASVLFGCTILVRDRAKLKIRLKDFWCFFGSGICSLLFFTVCYYQTIKMTSLSTAAILLYTAPSFVMLMSLIFFGERMTGRKVAALIMAFLGCCLVSGLSEGAGITSAGLIYGVCAGFGYALYSIFARFAMLRGYTGLTINFYSCLLASIGAGAIWGFADPVYLTVKSYDTVFICLGMGVVVSYLPYMLYTYGLTKTETGKASIMASVELVVATVIGVIVFHERIGFITAAGAALILGAIAVLNTGKAKV